MKFKTDGNYIFFWGSRQELAVLNFVAQNYGNILKMPELTVLRPEVKEPKNEELASKIVDEARGILETVEKIIKENEEEL